MSNILMGQVLPLAAQTITLGGPPVSFDLERSSLISDLYLVFEGIVGTAVGTLNNGGAWNIAQSISVKGNKNQGGAYNPVQAVSGAAIAAWIQSKFGELPKIVNPTLGTGRFTMVLPLRFLEPAFGDLRSWTNAIPAMLMSSLQVTVTPSTTAQVDVGTGALVFSSLQVSVVQYQAMVQTIPRFAADGKTLVYTDPGSPYPIAIPFTDMTLSQNIYASGTGYNTSANSQFFEPAGAYYADLLYLANASASARQLDTTAVASTAPINNAAGSVVELYTIGRTVMRSQSYQALREELHDRCVDTELDGVFGWAFAKGGRFSLLDTNLAAQTQGNLQVTMPTVTSSNGSIVRVSKTINDPTGVIVGG